MRLFLLICALLAPGLAEAATRELNFKVEREGGPMGSHTVKIRQEGARTFVDININLKVQLGPFTLFRYKHHNAEIWEGGRLISLATETDDDGTPYRVRGTATANGFEVEGSGGRLVLPANVLPTSYWRRESVQRAELLDTQRGVMVKVETKPEGTEMVQVGNKLVEAERFQSKGELVLTKWYDKAGNWVKLSFTARGSDIEYKLAALPTSR